MKKFKALLVLTLSLFILSTISVSAKEMEVSEDKKTVTVNANALVMEKPDTANFNISLSSYGKTANESLLANNAKLDKMKKALETAGIKKEEYTIYSSSVYPNYADDNVTITSYRSYASMDIKTKNFANVNTFVAVALDNGAESISNIFFTLSNDTVAYNKALALALDNAKVKANHIASLLGLKIDSIINFVEISDSYNTSYYSEANGGGMASDNAKQIEAININELIRDVAVEARIIVNYSVK